MRRGDRTGAPLVQDAQADRQVDHPPDDKQIDRAEQARHERVFVEERQEDRQVRRARQRFARVVERQREQLLKRERRRPSATTTANTCLKVASPPSTALNTAKAMPATMRPHERQRDRAGCRRRSTARTVDNRPSCVRTAASVIVRPNDSMPAICMSSAAFCADVGGQECEHRSGQRNTTTASAPSHARPRGDVGVRRRAAKTERRSAARARLFAGPRHVERCVASVRPHAVFPGRSSPSAPAYGCRRSHGRPAGRRRRQTPRAGHRGRPAAGAATAVERREHVGQVRSAQRATRSSAARPVGGDLDDHGAAILLRACRRTQSALRHRADRARHRGQADTLERRKFGERARPLAEDRQQPEMRGRGQFAGRAELRGDRPHDERDDFEHVARAFARLSCAGSLLGGH